MSDDYEHKQRALLKGSILARYDGKCPYSLCGGNGHIQGGEDYISKGSLGWGHAKCVNAKIHYSAGGGHSLCKTTSRQRTTYNWDEVTCKKCLKLRDKLGRIFDEEAIRDFVKNVLYARISCTINPRNKDLVQYWAEKYDTEVPKLNKFFVSWVNSS